jgi:hypothetical protein
MDQKIIILMVIVVICSSCIALSVFGGVGGYFLMPDSTTTTIAPTPYSSGYSGSGSSDSSSSGSSSSGSGSSSSGYGSSSSGSSETAQTPDSSGHTYWDCMIGNDKKGIVSINWGHKSGDGGWACNEWKKECDKKCTANVSTSMDGVLDVEPRKDSCQSGWEEIDSDINKGCGGDTIKMCIKKGNGNKGVKSLSITNNDCPSGKDKHTYNLKSGTGSKTPDLYLCREYGYPFAKEVKVTDNEHTGWNYAMNGDTKQDLEKGCGAGSPTKYLVWQ